MCKLEGEMLRKWHLIKDMSPLQKIRVGLTLFNRRCIVSPLSTLHANVALRLWGASVTGGLRVIGRLRLYVAGRLSIGRNVIINSGPSENYIAGDKRTSIWVGRLGALTIGDGSGISNSTIICLNSITIHPNTLIGGGCEIYDTDFHSLSPAERLGKQTRPPCGEIAIGPGAFIGAGSLILKNVTIGEGAVVGARSVVTTSIPPFELWAGVPARFVRRLQAPAGEMRPSAGFGSGLT